jgi:hypothetical protein
MLGAQTGGIVPYIGLGELQPVVAPSGQIVELSPGEEREIVKQATSDKIKANLMIGTDVRKALISAVGTALGMAVGGLLISLLLKKKGGAR